MLPACLTCKNARKPRPCGMGQVVCLLSDHPHEVMYVCTDFEHFNTSPAFHNAERAEGFPSCSASTTATSSLRRDFLTEKPGFQGGVF